MSLYDLIYHSAVTFLLFLASLGLGRIGLKAVRLEGRGALYFWVEIVFGLGLLSLGTLFLGLAGLLYPSLFVPLLGALAVLGGLRLRQAGPVARRVRDWLLWREETVLFRIGAYLLLGITASTILWITLTHALMPPHEWDEIAYHLTLAKLYVQAHEIIYVPYIVQSNWPLNMEMLFAVALLLGSDIAPHLLMLGQALLIGIGILLVARRIFNDRVGIIALALFFTIPLVKRLAGTGLIDVALGLYFLAALVAFHYWRQQRQWQWLFLCAAFCGFAAGSKLLGGGLALLLGLLLLVDELRQRPFDARGMVRHLALFGLVGLLVVGPWYARSYFLTGNPIWPFAYGIFGGRDWDEVGNDYLLESLLEDWSLPVADGPLGVVQLYGYLLFQPKAMGGYRGGLGFILPVAVLFSALLLRRAPPFLSVALFVCLGFYLLWFALVSLQIRFLLPIAPLLALVSAYLFVWLYERVPAWPLRGAMLLALLLLILVEWPWTMQGERDLFAARLPYLRGALSREAWLGQHIDSLPFFQYANEELGDDALVLLLPFESRSYYLDVPYVWGHPISQRLIPFERFNSAETLAATLQEMGITHVIDVPTWIDASIRYWDHNRALMLELQQRCGEPLMQQGDSVLYVLTPCRMGAEGH